MVPVGTSSKIVELLNREVAKILLRPAVQEHLAKIGFYPLPGSPANFAQHIKSERAEGKRVVDAANIRIE